MEQDGTGSFVETHRPILLFVAAWATVNMFQAWWLSLDPDEAYYWAYAHRLDWGYFDHPPMVALLARLGIDWYPGALGVRLGNIGVHVGTIFYSGNTWASQRQGLRSAPGLPCVWGFLFCISMASWPPRMGLCSFLPFGTCTSCSSLQNGRTRSVRCSWGQ